MRLEVTLSHHDLANLFADLLPLQIRLGAENHYIAFFDPEPLELVPGAGLRLVCKAKISWPVLGTAVPIAIHRVVLRVTPEIVDQHLLYFQLKVEHADFALLPDFIDAPVTDRINAELARRSLCWPFAATFTRVIPLGDAIVPPLTLGLETASADVRITERAVTMTVAFRARVEREGSRGDGPNGDGGSGGPPSSGNS
jgi:hypothetical protein